MVGVRTGEQGGGGFFAKFYINIRKILFLIFAYQEFQFASDATVLKLKKGKKEVVTWK